jgi:hypothetical protein
LPGKHNSLVAYGVSGEEKQFYNIGTRKHLARCKNSSGNIFEKMAAYKNIYYRGKQGILTEGEGSVQLTFSLRLVFNKRSIIFSI